MSSSANYKIIGAAGVHIGDRGIQQDRVALIRHPRINGVVLGVVADGVGGHSGGHLAADEVIRNCTEWLSTFELDGNSEARLRSMAQTAHTGVRQIGLRTRLDPHSTIAAFLVLPDWQCLWVHSGDSRIYHFHRGKLVAATKDHSLVQQLVDSQQISREQARKHPQANVLLGVLGSATPPPIDLKCISRLRANDAIVACSDGVWNQLEADEIGQAVDQMDCRDATKWLIETALTRARGRSDNLSVIVVKALALRQQAAVCEN